MKTIKSFLFLIILVLLLIGTVQTEKKDLPEKYRKWLETEVVYIIGPTEREVFLQLSTDRERDLYIEAFWKQRDPTPGTPENEFKKEHFRRINHVNHYYGRTSPKPGWKTDRGRIYIILGEPMEVQKFEGKSSVYPSEVWFYQRKSELGLPAGFNLVFFQQGGVGDYKLYSPLQDGPQALMTSYYGDPADFMGAYEKLKDAEPLLAQVSLSLIPGEQSVIGGRPSLASDMLINRIESTPQRLIKEAYAQKFLMYKDIVEVEYSANYINNDSLIKLLKSPSGIYFIHYAIELDRLSVNQYENKYYTTLKMNGNISNKDGNTIFQYEKTIALDISEDQMKKVSHKPLSIRDMFPMIPGSYKISVLLKNEVSKEFTSVERNLLIPSEDDRLQMTSLILGFETNQENAPSERLRPFQLGKNRIQFQANRIFLKSDQLCVVFQIHGLKKEMRERGILKYVIMREDQEFRAFTKKITDYTDSPNYIESIPLNEFPPSHYEIQVSLFFDGKEIITGKEKFSITHLSSIARPWIYSRLLPPVGDPLYSFILGTQLYKSDKLAEAEAELEKAYSQRKDSIEFAYNLSLVYFSLKKYDKTVRVLQPFFNQTEPPKYDVYFLYGRALKYSEVYDGAIEVFNEAASRYGINVYILNELGETYFKKGDFVKALASWEKSLEINSNQPQIRELIEAVKEKK